MGVGLTFADEDEWCTVHDAPMMFHTCSGTHAEPLGYCESWDGTKDDSGFPTCDGR